MDREEKYYSLYKSTLKELALLSTCSRLQVAAIIVDHGQILMSSYNGVMSGQKHCNKIFEVSFGNYWTKDKLDEHHEFSTNNEGHAEQNLIAQCARKGISTDSKLLCVTYSPCVHCAKVIITAGINKVLYMYEYDRETNGLDLLKKCNILCEKF